MNEITVGFHDGIGEFECNGTIYEIIREVRVRGYEEGIVKVGNPIHTTQLFDIEWVSSRAHERHKKLVPAEIKSIYKIVRERVYPIDAATYFTGDKVC